MPVDSVVYTADTTPECSMLGQPTNCCEESATMLGKREVRVPESNSTTHEESRIPFDPRGCLEERVQYLESRLGSTEQELSSLKSEFAKLTSVLEKLKVSSGTMYDIGDEPQAETQQSPTLEEISAPEDGLKTEDEDSAHYQLARKMYESSCSETDERDERSSHQNKLEESIVTEEVAPEYADLQQHMSPIIEEGEAHELHEGDPNEPLGDTKSIDQSSKTPRGSQYRGRGFHAGPAYFPRASSVKLYRRPMMPPTSYRGGYMGKNFQPYYNSSSIPQRGYGRGTFAYSRGFSRVPTRGYRGSFNHSFRGGAATPQQDSYYRSGGSYYGELEKSLENFTNQNTERDAPTSSKPHRNALSPSKVPQPSSPPRLTNKKLILGIEKETPAAVKAK